MTQRQRRPESVLVVVYTRQLEILLLERVQPAGFWQSITGSLEWGESCAAAAARELKEETGLVELDLRDSGRSQRFPILPEWRHHYAADVIFNREHVWYLQLDETIEVELNPDEHRQFEWLDFTAAKERVSSWTNREAIEALLE